MSPQSQRRYEQTNLFFTILTTIMLSVVIGLGTWALWSFKAYVKSELDDSSKVNAITYATKSEVAVEFLNMKRDAKDLTLKVDGQRDEFEFLKGSLGNSIKTKSHE